MDTARTTFEERGLCEGLELVDAFGRGGRGDVDVRGLGDAAFVDRDDERFELGQLWCPHDFGRATSIRSSGLP